MSILTNMSNRRSAAARKLRGLFGRGEDEPAQHAQEPYYDTAAGYDPAAYGDEPTQPEFYVDHYGEGSLGAYHLGKSYRGRQVVQDVSLAVRRGEAVGLLGPNGAGKTTVFYMITGLVQPDKGMIELDGHDVTPLPMYRRARLGIGYLPQEASIFRGLNVEDNIRAVLEVAIADKDAREAELEALLDEFDIKRLRKSPSIALSGGERRRCEIARALASQPSFMLLDEPFAGIDPIAVGDIQQLVSHLTAPRHRRPDHRPQCSRDSGPHRPRLYHPFRPCADGGVAGGIVADPDVRRYYLGEDFRM